MKTINPKTGGKQLNSIQCLRGLAATLVLLFHVGNLGVISKYGFYGVDIFFVISGYLMAKISEREVTSSKFMLDRVIRIVPLYWMVTFLICALSFVPGLFKNFTFDILELLKSLFFVPYQNNSGEFWPLIVPGWTLNYEMFFYAIFAICLNFNKSLMTVILLLLLLAFLGLTPLGQIGLLKFYTDSIILEFAMGIFAYWFLNKFNNTKYSYIYILISIAIFTIIFTTNVSDEYRAFTAGIAAAFLLIGAVLFEGNSANFKYPLFLKLIGDWSYSIYLLHGFVIKLVEKIIHQPLVKMIAALVITYFISFISYEIIEKRGSKFIKSKLIRD